MKHLTMTAIAVAIATTAMSTASFAGGRGPGPCTSSGNSAVGAEGPAMNGGQLMAGVGNCRHGSWRNSYGYYRGAPAAGYYDRGYGYRYREPGVSVGVESDRW